MCGISGIINSNKKVYAKKYYQAHSVMSHRGPDDEGFISVINNKYELMKGDNTDQRLTDRMSHILKYEDLPFVLGHHRLSILDLSENGHQPFVMGKYSLVYNGEIYNYIELREELKTFGHSFTTDCDTEVVLKAFIQWGVDCFRRFNGMWALALYNLEDKSLLLGRDRFGVKPLYFEQSGSDILFASEIEFFKTLHPHKINKSTALMYLYGNRRDCGEESFYEGVEQVLPAHYYIFKNGEVTQNRYWNFPESKISKSADEALEEFAHLFKSAIEFRLRSNVPIGCLLSGGLDSSLIASLVANDLKGQEINTYSAVYDEQQFSEENYIQETFKMYLTLKGNLVKISSTQLLEDMDMFLKKQGAPVRSLAVYAQYKLYEFIAKEKKVTVLLNGQGADECWAGYHNHYNHFFISCLLNGRISTLMSEMQLYAKNRNVPMQTLMKSVLKTFASQLVSPNLKAKLKSGGTESSRERSLTLDSKLKENFNYSALKEYLTYEDKNSMAFGKESRLPFLDYRLVELAFSLDDDHKIHNFENKKLVRDFARQFVSDKIVNRKDKMGFVTPQETWQRNAIKEPMLKTIRHGDSVFPEETEKMRQVAVDYFDNKNNDWASAWRYFNYLHWVNQQSS